MLCIVSVMTYSSCALAGMSSYVNLIPSRDQVLWRPWHLPALPRLLMVKHRHATGSGYTV